MAEKTTIMAWSECTVEVGETGAGDAMATDLTDIGIIKNQSATLESTDGDTLEAVAVGGKTVAKQINEGNFTLTVRVIEPTDELFTLFGLGTIGEGEFKVQTHLVTKNFSVQVSPTSVGAKGIRAPKCNASFKFGWSDNEGNYADITFEILHGAAGYWYSRFTKA